MKRISFAWCLATAMLMGCRHEGPQAATRPSVAAAQAPVATTGPEEQTLDAQWPCERPDSIGSVCFSPDGSHLWVSTTDMSPTSIGTVAWDLKSGRASQQGWGKIPVWGIPVASSDGTRLAGFAVDAKPTDPVVRCWDARTGRILFSVKATSQHSGGGLRLVTLSPDGHYLAASGDYVWSVSASVNPLGGSLPSKFDHAVFLWNVDTGEQLLHEKLGGHNLTAFPLFSPDGRWLATSSNDKVGLRIWDLATRKVARTMNDTIWGSLRFSRDGSLLVFSNWGAVQIVDAKQWKSILVTNAWTLPAVPSAAGDLVVAAEMGRSQVDGSYGSGRVVIYDVRKQATVRTITTPHAHIFSIDISPDGKCIVTADRSDIRFWDTATGDEITAPMKRKVPPSPTTPPKSAVNRP